MTFSLQARVERLALLADDRFIHRCDLPTVR